MFSQWRNRATSELKDSLLLGEQVLCLFAFPLLLLGLLLDYLTRKGQPNKHYWTDLTLALPRLVGWIVGAGCFIAYFPIMLVLDGVEALHEGLMPWLDDGGKFKLVNWLLSLNQPLFEPIVTDFERIKRKFINPNSDQQTLVRRKGALYGGMVLAFLYIIIGLPFRLLHELRKSYWRALQSTYNHLGGGWLSGLITALCAPFYLAIVPLCIGCRLILAADQQLRISFRQWVSGIKSVYKAAINLGKISTHPKKTSLTHYQQVHKKLRQAANAQLALADKLALSDADKTKIEDLRNALNRPTPTVHASDDKIAPHIDALHLALIESPLTRRNPTPTEITPYTQLQNSDQREAQLKLIEISFEQTQCHAALAGYLNKHLELLDILKVLDPNKNTLLHRQLKAACEEIKAPFKRLYSDDNPTQAALDEAYKEIASLIFKQQDCLNLPLGTATYNSDNSLASRINAHHARQKNKQSLYALVTRYQRLKKIVDPLPTKNKENPGIKAIKNHLKEIVEFLQSNPEPIKTWQKTLQALTLSYQAQTENKQRGQLTQLSAEQLRAAQRFNYYLVIILKIREHISCLTQPNDSIIKTYPALRTYLTSLTETHTKMFEKLTQGAPVEHLDAIRPEAVFNVGSAQTDSDLADLIEQIRRCLEIFKIAHQTLENTGQQDSSSDAREALKDLTKICLNRPWPIDVARIYQLVQAINRFNLEPMQRTIAALPENSPAYTGLSHLYARTIENPTLIDDHTRQQLLNRAETDLRDYRDYIATPKGQAHQRIINDFEARIAALNADQPNKVPPVYATPDEIKDEETVIQKREVQSILEENQDKIVVITLPNKKNTYYILSELRKLVWKKRYIKPSQSLPITEATFYLENPTNRQPINIDQLVYLELKPKQIATTIQAKDSSRTSTSLQTHLDMPLPTNNALHKGKAEDRAHQQQAAP